MNKNMMSVLLLIVGLVIGLVAGWLIFNGINTIGNATKSMTGNELSSTINNIMTKGVTEDSSDATYVKKLLTSNGYTTTDGRTYTNQKLSTTTMLCYLGDKSVGGNCTGSCTGYGDSCANWGCTLDTAYGASICTCKFTGQCTDTSGSCSSSGTAALD